MAEVHTPAWKCKQRAGALMQRVEAHARGDIEMTKTQLQAAQIFLRKVIPDLSSTTFQGDAEKPLQHKITVDFSGK